MYRVEYTLAQLVDLVQPLRVEGNTTIPVMTGIAGLKQACEGDISFLGNTKYKGDVPQCRATVVLVNDDYVGTPRNNQVYFYTENASRALDRVCRHIEQSTFPRPSPGVHPSAVLDPSAEVSPEASVGPLCVVGAESKIDAGVVLRASVFVGDGVEIGKNTFVNAHATILAHTVIGGHCFVDSGVVLGSDGYGYETFNGAHQKSPQIGRVVLENNVDVGANTTIDRARFYETRIGEGTKIDNLVQIGHNVSIGKNCFIVAFVGIAGSTTIEDNCVIAGQVGIAGHLRVGRGSMLGAQTGLNHDLDPGSYVRGTPAIPYVLAHRIDLLKQRLPEMFKRLDRLEQTVFPTTSGGNS